MKVLHVITGLDRGGAENALYRLVAADEDPARFHVVSLLGEGLYGPKLRAVGAQVSTLDMRSTLGGLLVLPRLIKLLRDIRPNVVQTWMYHANLVGGVAARIVGIPVCWGIRQSDLSPKHSKRSTRAVAQVGAWSSRSVPDAIVSCGSRAEAIHREMGYADKFVVIANGLNLDQLRPEPSTRSQVRAELGLSSEALVVGHVSRADLMKDHSTLLRMFAEIAKSEPRATLLVAGSGLSLSEPYFEQWLPHPALRSRIVALGPRDDVPRLLNAMDAFVMSSAWGEGFPNVVAEALACGVPCVVTDCGDAAEMVGDTGWVRPVGDAFGLAKDVLAALREPPSLRAERSRRARERAIERFAIERMVSAYAALWRRVAGSINEPPSAASA